MYRVYDNGPASVEQNKRKRRRKNSWKTQKRFQTKWVVLKLKFGWKNNDGNGWKEVDLKCIRPNWMASTWIESLELLLLLSFLCCYFPSPPLLPLPQTDRRFYGYVIYERRRLKGQDFIVNVYYYCMCIYSIFAAISVRHKQASKAYEYTLYWSFYGSHIQNAINEDMWCV